MNSDTALPQKSKVSKVSSSRSEIWIGIDFANLLVFAFLYVFVLLTPYPSDASSDSYFAEIHVPLILFVVGLVAYSILFANRQLFFVLAKIRLVVSVVVAIAMTIAWFSRIGDAIYIHNMLFNVGFLVALVLYYWFIFGHITKIEKRVQAEDKSTEKAAGVLGILIGVSIVVSVVLCVVNLLPKLAISTVEEFHVGDIELRDWISELDLKNDIYANGGYGKTEDTYFESDKVYGFLTKTADTEEIFERIKMRIAQKAQTGKWKVEDQTAGTSFSFLLSKNNSRVRVHCWDLTATKKTEEDTRVYQSEGWKPTSFKLLIFGNSIRTK